MNELTDYITSFSVTKFFDTGLEAISPIKLLRNGSLIFSGRKEGQRKLQIIQYNIHTGTELRLCVFFDSILFQG